MILLVLVLVTWQSVKSTPPTACGENCERTFTFAVIGDLPYGAEQVKRLPDVVAQINADPDVQMVIHLGDIKDDESQCSNAYYRRIKSDFDLFTDPLVYTFGDNEWSDCSRTTNGRHNPLERLDVIRKIFFARPGVTLGKTEPVTSQSNDGFPENVMFSREQVAFAAFHTVGPRNGLGLWKNRVVPTAAQQAEVTRRTAADLKLIRAVFAQAQSNQDRAVVLFTQADMFAPTFQSAADAAPYRSIVSLIAEESRRFKGPVFLFNGDSHAYVSEQPLANAHWLAVYHEEPAENVIRVTVDGDENAKDYLKVTKRENFSKALVYNRIPFE